MRAIFVFDVLLLSYVICMIACNRQTQQTELNTPTYYNDSVVFNVVGDYCNVDTPSVKINVTNKSETPTFLDCVGVCKYSGPAWLISTEGEIAQPFLQYNLHKQIPQKSNIDIDIDYTVDSITEYSGLYYVIIQYRIGNQNKKNEGGCWFQTLPITCWKDENGNKIFMVGHKKNLCPPDSVLLAIKHNSDSIKTQKNRR